MKKLVFLGTKPIGAACLDYLLINKLQLQYEVIAVATRIRNEFSNEKTVGSIANQYQIPIIHHLDDLPECDIIYSVQYHQLLNADHINKAKQIAVNLHLAPLPEYRGCNQFSFAIMDQAESFGVSIHQIDEKIDHGRLLFEDRFHIPDNIWVDDLLQITVEKGLALFKSTLSELISGHFSLKEYAPHILSQLHYRNEIDDLKQIDLSLPKNEIERRIRATLMPGFEPPYCIIDGIKIHFTKRNDTDCSY